MESPFRQAYDSLLFPFQYHLTKKVKVKHPLVWSLFVVSNFYRFSTLPFHPLPQTSFHRPKPQVVSVQVNPPGVRTVQSSTQTMTFQADSVVCWKKNSSKVATVSANPSSSFLGGSNLLEEVISKLNRRKVSRFQRKNFWFFAQTHPNSPLEIPLGCLGFHTIFYNDFGTKVMTWNYL